MTRCTQLTDTQWILYGFLPFKNISFIYGSWLTSLCFSSHYLPFGMCFLDNRDDETVLFNSRQILRYRKTFVERAIKSGCVTLPHTKQSGEFSLFQNVSCSTPKHLSSYFPWVFWADWKALPDTVSLDSFSEWIIQMQTWKERQLCDLRKGKPCYILAGENIVFRSAIKLPWPRTMLCIQRGQGMVQKPLLRYSPARTETLARQCYSTHKFDILCLLDALNYIFKKWGNTLVSFPCLKGGEKDLCYCHLIKLQQCLIRKKTLNKANPWMCK